MATTVNLDIVARGYTELDAMPILSGATVYNGAFVAVTTGYIVDGSSSVAGPKLIGIAKLAGDPQTATANGAFTNGVVSDSNNVCDVYTKGKFTVAFNTLAAANLGGIAFLKDNATLTVSSSETIASGEGTVGYVTKVISTTLGEVELLGYRTT